MNEIPNTFVIDFTQVLNVWVTLKFVAIAGTGLYASFGKGDGLNRLFKVIVFGVLVFMLTGCAGPDDSIISQSKTQQAQIQANADQQAQQALAQAQQNLQAQQAQAQQATALQVAQTEAQMARDDAQAQQAEALAQQAQANQLQAVTMSNAIVALDSANERTAAIAQQQLALGVVALGVVLGGLFFVIWWKIQKQENGKKPIVVSRYDNMTGPQLLEAARQAGYLVAKDETGKWAIVDRNSLKRLNKKQLLLELKG